MLKILIALTISLNLFYCEKIMDKYHEIITVKDDEIGIIGYGSLMSVESMELTLGRKYSSIFKVVQLNGWERNWNVWMPNNRKYYSCINGDTIFPERILYLNVDSSNGSNLNCCLFFIKKSELAVFDQREWIYKRVDVTNNLKNIEIKNGVVYAYVALNEYKLNEVATPYKYGIRSSYLKILEKGFDNLGNDFKEKYNNSTKPFDHSLIFSDSQLPKH